MISIVKNFKFGLYVNGSKSHLTDDKAALKEALVSHVTYFRTIRIRKRH